MRAFKRLLKNEYVFSVLNRCITICISLVQSVLLARFLGSTLQGTSAYITSITSIASIILTFGMHQAYPYFRRRYGKDAIYNDYLTVITTLYGIYFLIATLLTIVISSSVEIRVAVLITPVLGLSSVVEYVALIENPNKRNFTWTILHFLDAVYAFVLFIAFKSTFILMVSTIILVPSIKIAIFLKQLNFQYALNKRQIHFAVELAKFGFLPMIALLLTTLNYKIDVLMLKTYDCITIGEIGVYSIGMNFADKVVLIPDTLKGVLVSRLSKGADEHEVAKVCRLSFWVSVAICLVFLLVGNPLINFLYGNEYNGAYSVLMICAVGSVFVGYFKLIAQYNIINKKQIRNVILLSSSIILNIILNMVLIPRYQLNGAAFASGVGYFFSGLIFIIWFAKNSKLTFGEMFLIQKSDLNIVTDFLRKRRNKT